VHDTFFVKLADANDDLSGVELDDAFIESLLLLKDFVKFTTIDKRHDKVKARL